jgi:hypothetical protein
VLLDEHDGIHVLKERGGTPVVLDEQDGGNNDYSRQPTAQALLRHAPPETRTTALTCLRREQHTGHAILNNLV